MTRHIWKRFITLFMDKRVLIVAYYWPPSGGSGVQRWLKFVKYLVYLGWEPIIVTPENPSFATLDPSLLHDIPPSVEVIRIPIWEPHHIFNKVNKWLGKKEVLQGDVVGKGKKSCWLKVMTWLRGNLFIPDSRVFWVKPVVAFLKPYIASKGLTKLVTTGPPHSLHLIGLRLKEKIPSLTWLADMRDPWSEWDVTRSLYPTAPAMDLHRYYEREVLKQATRVTTVGKYYAKQIEELGGRPVDIISNGFDEDDFGIHAPVDRKQFIIRQVGVIELRDPRPFMQAIKEICDQHTDFKNDLRIEYIGHTNQNFLSEIKADETLRSVTHFLGYLPHQQVLAMYPSSALLLLILAPSINGQGDVSGKMFEYMAARRPILALGPEDGNAAEAIKMTGAGVTVGHHDKEEMKNQILHFYAQWKNGEEFQPKDISPYSRLNLTKKLVTILSEMQ